MKVNLSCAHNKHDAEPTELSQTDHVIPEGAITIVDILWSSYSTHSPMIWPEEKMR